MVCCPGGRACGMLVSVMVCVVIITVMVWSLRKIPRERCNLDARVSVGEGYT